MKRTFLDSDIEKFNRDFKSFVEKQLNYSVFESFVAKAVAKTSGEFSKEIKKEVPRFFKTFSQKKWIVLPDIGEKKKNKLLTMSVREKEYRDILTSLRVFTEGTRKQKVVKNLAIKNHETS